MMTSMEMPRSLARTSMGINTSVQLDASMHSIAGQVSMPADLDQRFLDMDEEALLHEALERIGSRNALPMVSAVPSSHSSYSTNANYSGNREGRDDHSCGGTVDEIEHVVTEKRIVRIFT